MMKPRFAAFLIVVPLAVSCLTGCSQPGINTQTPSASAAISSTAQPGSNHTANAAEDGSSSVPGSTVADSSLLSVNVSNSDTSDRWDESATKITLNGSTATVNGSGASVNGSVVTITQEGEYVLSGTLDDGQIAIAATSSDKVHLILNNIDIANQSGAPIYAAQCDKLILTLAEGTQNVLTDAGERFQYADIANEEPNAALFCKDDLTINGTGSLKVNAGFNNGIVSKDDLVVISGNVTIAAANHGLRGNDSITVLDGKFAITAGNDGMQTHNTEDVSLGWILIEGGDFEIISAHDGIQADTALSVSGGQFKIIAGGQAASAETTSDSYKGIKASGDISITGGSFIIESADDAVHANGTITVSGGDLILSSGDDAVHADGDLTILGSSTNIEILTSYEGLEAKTMTISGGIISLYAMDDGINIAGGNDTNGGGRFGGDKFNAANSERWLKITGGTIVVTAGRDGIDINGSGEMTGGDVSVTAATLGEGNTIDSDGAFARTGGNLTESGGNSFGGMGGRGTGSPGGRK